MIPLASPASLRRNTPMCLLAVALFCAPCAAGADAISTAPGSIDEATISAANCNPEVVTQGAWTPRVDDSFARRAQSLIYDSKRDRLVAFGGSAYFNRGTNTQNIIDYYNNQVWVRPADLSTPWQLLAPVGTPPATRAFHTAIYDPIGDRMIVFGGNHGVRGLRDLWELDFTTDPPAWRALAAAGTAPAARYDHSALYDPVARRMLIFGGVSGDWSRATYDISNDFWALSLEGPPTWQRLFPAGSIARRQGQRSTYDSLRNRWILSGGAGRAPDFVSTSFLTDVEALDLSTLVITRLPDMPPAQYSLFEHSIDYDTARDRLLVFGGAEHFDNGIYELPLGVGGAWRRLGSLNSPPEARVEHATWLDTARNRLAIFGGGHTQNPLPGTEVLSFGRAAVAGLDPGRPQIPINPRSRRPVSVVLYGTALLPANSFDPASIRVGDAAIDLTHDAPELRDVDADGIADLVFDVAARDIAGDPNGTTVPVTANTRIGEPVCSTLDVTLPGRGPHATLATGGAAEDGVVLSATSPTAAGSVRIRLRAGGSGPYTLELYSVRGAVVARRTVDGPVDGWFDLAGGARLVPGLYWARVVGMPPGHATRVVVLR